jgi:hypothetical protein
VRACVLSAFASEYSSVVIICTTYINTRSYRPKGAVSPLLPVACRRSASLAKYSAVLRPV